ncbi:outer membrane protein assembly factor BamB [Xylella fastidiosa subsp. pauca]|uniref:outer membrane protein assembly factor BamB n=1 Tax=Xylella fastidiosa TaxID=2371 RepID=UPI0005835544|nr:outer membrane protein assembly factor BamB [Xylella fastidiosa]ARO68006.1 outer membrane protein assembly factor BamB [Xylella fastidiosa subsp. pauca]AVI20187.1 outer membrane protein assembly factor BamB [Xylella fastidiosa]AVI22181.1 outer membrane protein assembly factor BamB [Xylella fastidiosa]KIA59184.1 lipoprotein [Xylella fastidiosa]KXB12693.1 outer membrane protein assembly factor BamB [Xylella fastidiosa]
MRDVMKFRKFFTIALFATVFVGCGSVKNVFRGKDADARKAQEPADLADFTPTVKVGKLWAVDLGKGEGRIGVRQRPTVVDGKVYAAVIGGGVLALDLHTGQVLWKYVPAQGSNAKDNKKFSKKSMLRLAGGPGVGDGLVVIGTLDGQVIALDQNDGTEKWRANVPNEVIAAPAVVQNMVFVRSNDGRVTAFEGATGQRRWFTERESPSLTVRGNAPVIPGTDLLFVGNDDGTISALAMHDGNSLWVQSVAMPEGRSELERMADVDGVPVLEGNTLYATSYKNETVAIDGASGRMLWNREHGGAGGVGVSSNYIVVTDNDGIVWGLDKPTGSASWSQPALARRFLTGVAIQGDYAVVGDYKGYLHWLRLSDGALAARERSGSAAIVGQPVVADNVLLVQSSNGKLAAFRMMQ